MKSLRAYPLHPYLLLLCFLGCLPGCLPPRDPLPALWFYTHEEGATNAGDSLLTPASFLELRPDGSYTRDFGSFQYGTWDRKDRVLHLTDQQHTIHSYSLAALSGKEMQLTQKDGGIANFESQPLPSASIAEDPFALANNLWRLPASHKESSQEITKRLFNHCQFWTAYFTWALKNSLSTVDVRSTPTLIKIYGNGFGLKPFEELPPLWKSYFFDEEDCRKANDIIKNIFETRSIAWGHTDNKYKMFIGAFQQMEKYLR